MAMDAGEIERLIKAHIPDAQVTIRDLAGDGDHYAATVISASFKGKSRVQQHQLVYEALKGQMGGVLVEGDEARIRQGFMNMKLIAESEGAGLSDCVRLTVFVTDMNRLRPLVNKVQEQLWSGGPYPPRSIVEVARLNQDDFFEVEGTFYSPKS
jgi:stress-induced morphogen